MEQYIPKSVLVAEIDRLRRTTFTNFDEGVNATVQTLLETLNNLEVKEVDVWKTVDNINPPQADKNKIYCVFTKDRYILATVINHPKDEELLQWKCTEFPHHRYDMCEGDKYMQIV